MNLIGCRGHESFITRLPVGRGAQNKLGKMRFHFDGRILGRNVRHRVLKGTSHDLYHFRIKLRHAIFPFDLDAPSNIGSLASPYPIGACS